MSTYLKNMAGYKYNQLKSKTYDEIQKMFGKEMKRVNIFIDMDTELVKGSKTRVQESSSKRAGTELEPEVAKKHMEIVIDEEEVTVNAIPLATKPLIFVEYKIVKEGKIGYFQVIRADGSSKGPEEEYERVLWGDLKVIFEPDIESEVWRSVEGHNATVWKLFDSRGVHSVRFKNLHIFMLVEKKYPLTPAIITGMLNKKLQVDQWNEMSYQLLKLLVKQQKNPGSGRIVRIKSLLMLLGVNTTKVRVTAVKHNLVFDKTTAWNEFSSTMASAIICLATNQNFNFSKYIFDNMMKNLEGRVKFLMFLRFVQVFLDKQVEGRSKHKGIYVTPSHTKKVFANMKRPGKGFFGKVTPLFQTMMVQAPEDMGKDLIALTDPYPTPIITQPSSSKPQKK
ncbi:hypothetical protein Tco_1560830 [Tanacetum coccineum]